MEGLYVKPAREGLLILYPDNPRKSLPQEGALVPLSSYWKRAVKRGDVIVAEQPSTSE